MQKLLDTTALLLVLLPLHTIEATREVEAIGGELQSLVCWRLLLVRPGALILVWRSGKLMAELKMVRKEEEGERSRRLEKAPGGVAKNATAGADEVIE